MQGKRKDRLTGKGLKPDPVYHSRLVSKFINCMMWDGKKATVEQVFYKAMGIIADRTGENPYEVFEKAVENVKPIIEVKSKRVGGATYQVPVEVSDRRRLSLAIRWIREAARGKKGRSISERLASELIDARNKTGEAMTRRENVHRMAEANKAFSHFA